MENETRIWNMLGLLVALLTSAAPIFVTYDLFKKDHKPELKIEVAQYSLINPLGDLSPLGNRIKLELQIDEKSYNNIAIKQFTLRNKGSAPVEAQDFHKPLSVSVEEPWEIIAVGDAPIISDPILLEWSKVSKQQFKAKPFLLNPGDTVWQTVYLTNTDPAQASSIKTKKHPSAKVELRLNARIVNMRQFSKAVSIFDRYRQPIGTLVYLDFPAVLLLLCIASVFLYWYVRALVKSGVVRAYPINKSCLFFVGAAILSYATAEVITFYIVGGEPIRESIFGRDLFSWKAQWHNWAILLIHIAASIYLYRKCKNA